MQQRVIPLPGHAAAAGGNYQPRLFTKLGQNLGFQSTEGIFAVLRKYEYDPDLMRLVIAGGGGCLVKNFGQYDESRVTILDDICAAAKGYEFLAYSSLRRKERV